MSEHTPEPGSAGRPGHGGVLTIDLGALAANYRELAGRARPARTAAAIKADAYGLGLEAVALTLHEAGCRTFFVAHLNEARSLRAILGERDGAIYVLNGLLPGTAPEYAAIEARPVLGSLEEIGEWRAFAGDRDAPPAGVQIDTGFTRLGLGEDGIAAIMAAPERISGLEIALVLSHLACADEPDHPMNADQLARFKSALPAFSDASASLANSAGIALGPGYHFDMVRPGIALYGGRAASRGSSDMAPVVQLEVPVIQIRDAEAGSSVGYGATYRFAARRRVALVSIGYADGLARAYGASNKRPGGQLFIAGQPCPIVGRVSMDVTAIDVSQLPGDALRRGAMVEVLGPNQSIDDLAMAGGTIGYEVLTRLGLRHARVYSRPTSHLLQSGADPL